MTFEYVRHTIRCGTGDFAPGAELTDEQRAAVAAAERGLEASFLNTVYERRRQLGLADNDAGMGRIAETETRDWRGGRPIYPGVVGVLKAVGVKL